MCKGLFEIKDIFLNVCLIACAVDIHTGDYMVHGHEKELRLLGIGTV
jgi:hypothetical protein